MSLSDSWRTESKEEKRPMYISYSIHNCRRKTWKCNGDINITSFISKINMNSFFYFLLFVSRLVVCLHHLHLHVSSSSTTETILSLAPPTSWSLSPFSFFSFSLCKTSGKSGEGKDQNSLLSFYVHVSLCLSCAVCIFIICRTAHQRTYCRLLRCHFVRAVPALVVLPIYLSVSFFLSRRQIFCL